MARATSIADGNATDPRTAAAADVRLVWRGARGWTLAVVLAAFPFLFILDRGTAWSVSPVLPGLLVLAALMVLLPFVLTEAVGRIARRREAQRRTAKAERFALQARVALGIATLWTASWFILGL